MVRHHPVRPRAAECLYALVIGNRRPATVVSQLLHVVMAVAMAVMAWPWGAALPTVAPMVFFLFATGWFVGRDGEPARCRSPDRRRLPRADDAGDGLDVRGDERTPAARPGVVCRRRRRRGASGHAGHAGMNMPGMDMSGTDAAVGRRLRRRIPGLHRHAELGVHHRFRDRRGVLALPVPELRMNHAGSAEPPLGILCQAMMAAGMAIMFGVML